MSWYQYKPAPQTITTWAEANDFINKGRTKDSHRKLTKQRCLWRASVLDRDDTLYPDDIVFRLYTTDIIIYHSDGSFTIRHDGKTTRTTIWDIENHSPARLQGVPGTREDRGCWAGEFVVAHKTDRLTPPKVQKCRKCHGKGIVINTCHPSRSHPHRYHWDNEVAWPDKEWADLPGHEWREKHLPSAHQIKWGIGWGAGDYLAVGADTVLTRTNERPRRDVGLEPCYHGWLEPHLEYTECWRCGGEGTQDYGSKPIHTPMDGDGIRITADGRPIRPIEEWAEQIATLRQIRQRMRRQPV